MATFLNRTNRAVAAASTPATTDVKEKYYRFFSNKDEFYWSFAFPPSNYCLEMTCKALKLPNYEEIDEIEFRRAYRH